MVNDVADVLEQSAAGLMHTPALYSTFLRALISAKTEPSDADNGPQTSQTPNTDGEASQDQPQSSSSNHAANNGTFMSSLNDPLSEFQFDSEMGPVADISTFPPTMAPNPTEDHLSNMLTMDSILSASFWDSVLVPGMSSCSDEFCTARR